MKLTLRRPGVKLHSNGQTDSQRGFANPEAEERVFADRAARQPGDFEDMLNEPPANERERKLVAGIKTRLAKEQGTSFDHSRSERSALGNRDARRPGDFKEHVDAVSRLELTDEERAIMALPDEEPKKP